MDTNGHQWKSIAAGVSRIPAGQSHLDSVCSARTSPGFPAFLMRVYSCSFVVSAEDQSAQRTSLRPERRDISSTVRAISAVIMAARTRSVTARFREGLSLRSGMRRPIRL